MTLTTDGISFQPLVFLPVTNLKQLLESLSALIGEAARLGRRTLRTQRVRPRHPGQGEGNGWAFVGQNADAVNAAPADPAKLLGGLDKDYDVAIRLHVQNIPELIARWRSTSFARRRRRPGPWSRRKRRQYEARKKIIEKQIEALTTAINDIDQLTLGAASTRRPRGAHRSGHHGGRAAASRPSR